MPANPQLDLAHGFLSSTGENVFLTGRAGTGKTTFLHRLRERSPKRMIVAAPTGIAAINAGGVTMHSFFQLPFGIFIPGSTREGGETRRFSKAKIAVIKSVDLLVIDEISMVRADLLDSVDEVLRRFRDRTKPFGGVRENRVDERTLEALNTRHRPGFDPPQSEGYVTLASHNHTARRINDDKLARISAKEYLYRADIEGEFPEYLYRSMNGKPVKMQKT